MIGQTLGHHRILGKIGEGGMGVVYRAHDEQLDRDVALKVLPAGVLGNDSARKRFRKEALALAKLNHPNIETVYEFGCQNGVDFLVMEFVPGVGLNEKLSQGALSEKQLVRIGAQLAEGLAAAHAQGVVHRDLKPGNLRLTLDGRLKILDLGLAKLLHPAGDIDRSQSLTEMDALVGTLPYMAPEQLRGEHVDARTDIYAAGAVLYELATGRRPFPETYAPRLIDSVLHNDPPPPSSLNRSLSPRLEGVILKALQKDPAGRYQSAGELRIDLERVSSLSDSPQALPPTDQSQAPKLEMAHVLFMDIVGYSKLPMEQQQETLRQLQKVVRGTVEFGRAQAQDQLIGLPTGDGMALVFFGDPAAPVRCAVQLSGALRKEPEIKLRMGVHTGPVYRIADINANRNVAGGGINIAQRVMDCGDAGHILVSEAVADVLSQLSSWADCLHDLGDAEVKHGLRVRLFNFYGEEFGNPKVPQKLPSLAGPAAKGRRRGLRVGVQAGTVVALLFLGLYLYLSPRRGGVEFGNPAGASSPRIKERRSVAMLGLKNLSGRPEEAWLSTALSEMLNTELAAGEQLRTIPGENVARMKIDLSLPDSESYAQDTLARIRKNIGSDFIVLGSYLALGGGQVRLDLRLQDAATGQTLAAVKETGMTRTEADVSNLVSRTGTVLRERLGLRAVTGAEASEVKASLPANSEAARLYSKGLAKLRVFDALGARDLLQKAIEIDPNYALGHSALAATWVALGEGKKAKDEAKTAFDLSGGLSRESRLLIEARYRLLAYQREEAIEILQKLANLFPDSLDYGLELATAQTIAGHWKDALATVQSLRSLQTPDRDSPRIDLAEAAAAKSVQDFELEQAAAAKAAEKGRQQGRRLLVAEARFQECEAFYKLGNRNEARAACEEADQICATAANEFCRLRIATANMMANRGYVSRNLVGAESRSRVGVMKLEIDEVRVLFAEGDLREAKKVLEQWISTARAASQSEERLSRSLFDFGEVLTAEDQLTEAGAKYREALAIASKLGLGEDARYRTGLAELSIEQGHPAEAETIVRRVIEDLRSRRQAKLGQALMGRKPEIVWGLPTDDQLVALVVLARALLAQGRTSEAQKEMHDATWLKQRASRELRLKTGIVEARIRYASDDSVKATQELDSLLSEATQFGIVPEQLEARLALGEIQMKSGKPSVGRTRLEALEKEATAKGFLLIARKAVAAKN